MRHEERMKLNSAPNSTEKFENARGSMDDKAVGRSKNHLGLAIKFQVLAKIEKRGRSRFSDSEKDSTLSRNYTKDN